MITHKLSCPIRPVFQGVYGQNIKRDETKRTFARHHRPQTKRSFEFDDYNEILNRFFLCLAYTTGYLIKYLSIY